MRHQWENKTIAEGEFKVVERCVRCGHIRTRTNSGSIKFYGGRRKCGTVSETLNRETAIAAELNKHLRFYALASALLFFVSCCPARDLDGRPWRGRDVRHRVFAK